MPQQTLVSTTAVALLPMGMSNCGTTFMLIGSVADDSGKPQASAASTATSTAGAGPIAAARLTELLNEHAAPQAVIERWIVGWRGEAAELAQMLALAAASATQVLVVAQARL
jgi:hypothetical protein